MTKETSIDKANADAAAADITSEYFSASEYTHGSKTLYKYVTQEALLGLFRNGSLKVAYRHDANDPFEFLPLGRLPNQYHEDEKELGFVSLTALDNCPSMWGNYAAKYTGARLRFDIPYFKFVKEDLEFTIKSSVRSDASALGLVSEQLRESSNDEIMFIGLHKEYRDSFQLINSVVKCYYSADRFNRYEFVYDFPNKGDEECVHKFKKLCFSHYIEHARLMATKHTSWRQEDEYRALIACRDVEAHFVGNKPIFLTHRLTPFITHITLAPYSTLSECEVRLLLANCKPLAGNGVKVNRAAFSPESYLLDIPQEYRDGAKEGGDGA